MTREMRIRSAGVLFYIVLLVTVLLTEKGCQFITSMLGSVSKNTGWAGLLLTATTFGMAIFTSDAIGWVLSAIATFVISPLLDGNMPSGHFYDMEWSKLTYYDKLKDEITKHYKSQHDPQHSDKDAKADERRWKHYSDDIVLSYFWQQGPERIVEWVSRRYTAFFIYRSSAVGILLALIASGIVVCAKGLGASVVLWASVCLWVVLMAFLWFMSDAPRREARQMVDLWLHAAFDDRMRKAVNSIQDRFPKTCRHRDSPKDSSELSTASTLDKRRTDSK